MEPAGNNASAMVMRHAKELERYLAGLSDSLVDAPEKLIEAVRYSLMAGGKRVRPALVLESHDACGGKDRRSAMAAAAAMELVHTFSLVHDDLPAMDDDDLRRGVPTNHKVFGEAMAILAGDAMITLAFEVLASDAAEARAAALVRELARAAGPEGMIGGQVLDMEAQGRAMAIDELRRLHRMKTGALFVVSCRLGAIAAGADAGALEAVTAYGEHLGLAFQIVDDLLDVTATTEELGKAANKDAARGKNTYPTLLGVEESKARVASQVDAAIAALRPLGARAAGLATLAKFVGERRN